MKRAMAHRRTARLGVLVGLALVVLSQLALAVAEETFLPQLRDPEYGCRLRFAKKLHRQHPERPLVVAIGTSRTQMGLAPAVLGIGPVAWPGRPTAEPLVVNFGTPGATPLHEQLLLRRLCRDGLRPDAVLLEVLPAHLHTGPNLGSLLRADTLTHADLRFAQPYCDDPAKLRAEWRAARLSPLSTVRFTILSRLAPTLLPWYLRRTYLWENSDRYGWFANPVVSMTPEQHQERLANTHREYAENLSTFYVTPTPDKVLRETLTFCCSHHMRAALYLMPEGDYFRTLYPPGGEARLNEYLARLSRETGTPVFDTRTWLPEEAFLDSHHLLRVGALRFSARFGRELLGPWLRGEPTPPFPAP